MSVTIFGCGDIGPIFEPVEHLSSLVAEDLAAADIRFSQCERVYSNRGSLHPSSNAGHSRCQPQLASVFSDCGFDVVSLAGNHVMDWGGEALEDTIETFRAMGIKTIGAGRTIEEAREPAFFNVKGMRIAFLGYGSILREGFEATESRPGAAPLRVETWYETFDYQAGVPPIVHTEVLQSDLDAMADDIKAAKAQADIVIVSMHWGVHYIPKMIAEYQPLAAQVAFASGADAILGHHAHAPKAVEMFGNKPCFYSLSNFMMSAFPKTGNKARDFETNYGVKLDPNYPNLPYGSDAKRSLVAKLVVAKGEAIRTAFLPIEINQDLCPQFIPSSDPRFQDAVQFMEWVSEGRGTEFQKEGDEVWVVPSN
ncbi:CapA family protein [Motiliproteus sp. MSK22-1]|uniref:CapA family protein n=1 Tax=Motiliproteus sp. MSK22-1 TaxID=1897630 RepID=UPI000978AD6F|nr:CapA family protein [Motiliproteus sp. MSK22-1]OMH27550.1 hypothetical protein BGP75_22525 [Motiliproteus sp. MSK22-1]